MIYDLSLYFGSFIYFSLFTFHHPPTLPTSRDRLFAYTQAIAQGGIAGLVINPCHLICLISGSDIVFIFHFSFFTFHHPPATHYPSRPPSLSHKPTHKGELQGWIIHHDNPLIL
jgi:hypothetical protein